MTDPHGLLSEPVYVVMSTCPADQAGSVAAALVGDRLAACCNRIRGLESTYWWEGRLTTDAEDLLVFKTRQDLVTPLKERLALIHPYDVTEILAWPVTAGHDPYLRWVGLETAKPNFSVADA